MAYSRLDIALSVSLIVFLTLRLLTPIESAWGPRESDPETEANEEAAEIEEDAG